MGTFLFPPLWQVPLHFLSISLPPPSVPHSYPLFTLSSLGIEALSSLPISPSSQSFLFAPLYGERGKWLLEEGGGNADTLAKLGVTEETVFPLCSSFLLVCYFSIFFLLLFLLLSLPSFIHSLFLAVRVIPHFLSQ